MNLPESAKVNKTIPKNTFYRRLSISNKLKADFIDKIQKITWLYKISEKTTNIDKTKEVEEIQVFEIELKSKELPTNVIKIIDKAIPYPILYIFRFQEEFAYGVSLKGEDYFENYYFSDWNEKMIFDFNSNNLGNVYQNIIKKFIKNLSIDNKEFSTIVEEDKLIKELKKDIITLKRKIRSTKQFNKQVAFNQELLKKEQELKILQNN